MAFDLSKLDVVKRAEEGIDVHIVHPATGERLDIIVRIQGKYSDAFKQMIAKVAQREEKRKRGGGDEVDGMAEVMASVTLGWKGVVEQGKELVFSRAEALRVYSEYPIIRNQVWEAAVDDANFTEG